MYFWSIIKDYPGVAVFVSVMIFLAVFVLGMDQAVQIRRSYELQAEIVDYKTMVSESRRTGEITIKGYYPVVAYALSDGREFERTTETEMDEQPAVGSTISIYVDPQHPARGVLINDFQGLWGFYLISGTFSLLFMIGTVVFFYAAKRADKPVTLDKTGRSRLQNAIALYEAGDLRGSVNELSLVLDVVPSGLAYEWRGDAYARLGERTTAAADYRAAARMYKKEDERDNLRRALNKVETASA